MWIIYCICIIGSWICSAFIQVCDLVELAKAQWDMDVSAVIATIIGIVGVAANLKPAHILMNRYTERSKDTQT